MRIRKAAYHLSVVLVILTAASPFAQAIAPVDAVRYQLEHEFSAGRVAPDLRDELMEMLDEVKTDFQSGDEEEYRVHVDAFRDKVCNSPSTQIQSDAAERILSVARSLQ